MVIIGIDPGTVRVGYGVLEEQRGRLTLLRCGLLKLPKGTQGHILHTIDREFNTLLREFRPDRVGIERIFFTRNKKTAITIAQARGVLLAASARNGVSIVELTPSEVKCAVTGDGAATKAGVARMVHFLVQGAPRSYRFDDVSDAIAVAIAATGAR